MLSRAVRMEYTNFAGDRKRLVILVQTVAAIEIKDDLHTKVEFQSRILRGGGGIFDGLGERLQAGPADSEGPRGYVWGHRAGFPDPRWRTGRGARDGGDAAGPVDSVAPRGWGKRAAADPRALRVAAAEAAGE